NSVLAGASFTNLSRPANAHKMSVTTTFGVVDPPDDVCAMLTGVAAALPQLRPDSVPKTVSTGAGGYQTTIPLRSPGDDSAAKSTFLRWAWYASRRAALHLDEAQDDYSTPERLEKSLRTIAPILRLSHTDQQALLPHTHITRYGTDEALQYVGQVPKRMMFIVAGRVRLTALTDDGSTIAFRTLEVGDFLGQTALTREPVSATAHALEEVTVLQIAREYVEELVARKPLLLQEIGRAIEERRASLRQALAAAGQPTS